MRENRKKASKTPPRLIKGERQSDEDFSRSTAAYNAVWKAKMGGTVTQAEVDTLAKEFGIPPEALNLVKSGKGWKLSDKQLLKDSDILRLTDQLNRFWNDVGSVKISVKPVVVASAEEAMNVIPNEVYDPISGAFVAGRIIVDENAARSFREEAGMEEPTVSPAEIEEAMRERESGARFSISAEEDAAYLDAVKRGDKETYTRLLREVAARRGYTKPDYFDAHSAPSPAYVEGGKENFRNLEELRRVHEEDGGDLNLFAIANGISSVPEDFFTRQGLRWYGQEAYGWAAQESLNALRPAIDDIRRQMDEYGEVKDMPKVKVYRAVPKSVEEGSLQSEGQWVSPSKAYAVDHGEHRFGEGEYRIIEQSVGADELWFDGNAITEWGFDDGTENVYKNTKNNRKLFEPTYDDNGNLIPLSQRFNQEKADIRFSVRIDAVNALDAIANGAEYGILHNEKFGDIRYPLGKSGKGGNGLLHIIEQRMKKDGATLDEALEVAVRVGMAAEIGTETLQRFNTHHLDLDGIRAIVAKMPDNTAVITGYEIDTDEAAAANRRATAHNHSPHVSSEDVIRALREKIATTRQIIPQGGNESNGENIKLNGGKTSFSISAEEDAAYLDAVKRGDMETAQRMVREAAAKAMPNTKVVGEDGLPLVVYHATDKDFYVFNTPSYFAKTKDVAEGIKRFSPKDKTKAVFLNIQSPYELDAEGAKWYRIYVPDMGTMSINSIVEWKRTNGWKGYREDDSIVDEDGIIVENVMEGDAGTYNTTDYIPANPSQIKSADPVTYDDAGNVIPLSQRFNQEKADIRFSIVSDPTMIAKLESEPTTKTYRAMQLVDGKLYPPMAGKVNGKWQDAAEPGTWIQADERPDLVKDGKFTLNKGNGSSITAAYNPYWHTSPSPLNDQFSSAYKRPNLVTVEVEVPQSELTSGYRAEGAKDAVGEMSWHSGPVSSKLAKLGNPRKVILSRWCKVVRIVPDAEVADKIAEMLKDTNLTVPENVVTPSLANELRARGVNVTGDKARFSIAQLQTGEKFVLLDRPNKIDWNDRDKVRKYLTTLVGTGAVSLIDGERIEIGKDLPDEYTRSKYAEKAFRNIRLRKIRAKAAQHFDELIAVASERTSEPAKHKKREGGVYFRRKADFAVVGHEVKRGYSAELVTYEENGQEYLYDLVNIKDKPSLVPDSATGGNGGFEILSTYNGEGDAPNGTASIVPQGGNESNGEDIWSLPIFFGFSLFIQKRQKKRHSFDGFR